MRKLTGLAIVTVSLAARAVHAQATAAAPPPANAPTAPSETPGYETIVTATTPLHGSRLPLDHVPANVQTVTAEDLAEHHGLDLSAYMGEAVGSVHVNDVQQNPLQPDLQYRGFLASPLLGAPQGLSMYLDGVRLNEPFGDTINWDLIPTNAIRSVNVIPGSNPIFGLNTLGGALSLETKSGFSDPGADGTLLYGAWGRKLARASAGAHGKELGVFAAAQVFDEDGWRVLSPSRSEQAFLSTSYESARTTADLVLTGASTSLTGNGPLPEQLLAVDRRAIFTAPDQTLNQLFMALLRAERPLSPHARVSGTAHLRTNHARSLNGDQHDWAECAGMPGVLCSTNDAGTQTPVLDNTGAPVAFAGSYDAATNRTDTRETSYGAAAQLAVDAPVGARENHFFVGVDAGQSRVRFRSQTTVATLDDSRSTIDTGFLDPTSPIAVDGLVDDLGVYASDTLTLRPDLFLVLSGRFNLTSLSLEDQLGDELTGNHRFERFNPAAGLSYQPRAWLGAYASYSESNRAPTAIELTCASPTDPCRLPNAFVSDPPLAQVVARTLEAGARGRWRRSRVTLVYDVTAFRTTNSHDILFISSGMVANQGYFANVGRTRRQGLEADLSGRQRLVGGSRIEWSLHYTLTDATFETPFTARSATHPDAVNGLIDVPAGAHIPSIPEHVAKAAVTVVSTLGLSGGVNVAANSSQYYRGDEANLLAPIAGHVVVNARLAYQVRAPVSVFLVVDNVFDARYSTFGVLGDAKDVFPSYGDPRFLGPGAPRAAWAGVDLHL
ncbi:MAG TPA: TonB-dependent receptor [Polyangia bacterium]